MADSKDTPPEVPSAYDPLPFEGDAEVVEKEEAPPASTLAEPPAWEPSADQTAAMEGIQAWWSSKPRGDTQVLTVGGYAGSGKTTLTGKLAYDLIKENVRVAFATPTGKAATVLQKSLRESGLPFAEASTIHGLIYIPRVDEETGRVLGWRRQDWLDYDIIVVDEASMVDSDMLRDLQVYGVPILAVGDHGQLPPVGEEASLMRRPDFRLEKIHRQAQGNPIIRLATIIRNGAPDEAIQNFIRDKSDPRVQMTRNRQEAIEFGRSGMLLSYTNKLRTALNQDIRHDYLGYKDDVPPQVGETIICLKNKRLEDDGGRLVANGIRGVVVTCEDSGTDLYKATLQFDDPVGLVEDLEISKHQFLRDKTFRGFDEVPGKHHGWWSVGSLFDFGYALTVHKSQGSQADNVSVFMEWSLRYMSEDDRKRWMYTAVTRAAERLMIKF